MSKVKTIKELRKSEYNPYSWDLAKIDNKKFYTWICDFVDENTKATKEKTKESQLKEKDNAMDNFKNIFNLK